MVMAFSKANKQTNRLPHISSKELVDTLDTSVDSQMKYNNQNYFFSSMV